MKVTKTSKWAKIAICLLSLLTISGFGLAGWQYMENNNSKVENTELQSKLEDKEKELDATKTAQENIEKTTDASTENSIYENFAKNLAETNKGYTLHKSISDEDGFYVLTAKIQNDNSLNLEIKYISNDGKNTKIVNEKTFNEKVINIAFVHVGNGADTRLFFVREDGTVGNVYMYIDRIGENVENVSGVKDIVSIQQDVTGEMFFADVPAFIDIYGNKSNGR